MILNFILQFTLRFSTQVKASESQSGNKQTIVKEKDGLGQFIYKKSHAIAKDKDLLGKFIDENDLANEDLNYAKKDDVLKLLKEMKKDRPSEKTSNEILEILNGGRRENQSSPKDDKKNPKILGDQQLVSSIDFYSHSSCVNRSLDEVVARAGISQGRCYHFVKKAMFDQGLISELTGTNSYEAVNILQSQGWVNLLNKWQLNPHNSPNGAVLVYRRYNDAYDRDYDLNPYNFPGHIEFHIKKQGTEYFASDFVSSIPISDKEMFRDGPRFYKLVGVMVLLNPKKTNRCN